MFWSLLFLLLFLLALANHFGLCNLFDRCGCRNFLFQYRRRYDGNNRAVFALEDCNVLDLDVFDVNRFVNTQGLNIYFDMLGDISWQAFNTESMENSLHCSSVLYSLGRAYKHDRNLECQFLLCLDTLEVEMDWSVSNRIELDVPQNTAML